MSRWPDRRCLVALWLGLATLLGACESDQRPPDDPPFSPDPEPTASASTPSPSATTSPTAAAVLGPEITDVSAHVPGDAGFAWHTPSGIVLTNLAGSPAGHLPGWQLDREASDRLAAPVVLSPAGELHIITSEGIAPLSASWPIQDGAVTVEGTSWSVVGDDGDVRTSGDLSPGDALWVSATATVVGSLAGKAYDLEQEVALDVPVGCRLADRHEPDAPLHVCDGGARLTGGTDITAPGGGRWGWVTVGTTGDEILGTVHGGDADGAYLGSRAEGAVKRVDDADAALFFRSSGAAWVARLGPDAALLALGRDGRTSVLRDVPDAVDVMIWTR